MSYENPLQALDRADELTNALREAMIAGPDTEEWTVLQGYFADTPEKLTGLPSCREQIYENGSWEGSALGQLLVTFVKN